MRRYFVIFSLILSYFTSAQQFQFIEPSQYICPKIHHDFELDGDITKDVWQQAQWTDLFVDIEGRELKKPYYETRAKMLWSDAFLYFAFELKEEHIWATLTKRDTVIFYDNDIEIFIDGNGDTHNYIELELNALNTRWDLFLPKPYRQGGPPLNEFDLANLKTAVKINGTLNNPKDIDESWTVEVAIPWSNLITTYSQPRLPRHGEHMRINFSRVQWETEIIDNTYRKKKNPETGKNLHEKNWVWSPTGAINMHQPELWGIVYFTDNMEHVEPSSFYQKDAEELRQLLAHIYNLQRLKKGRGENWAKTLQELNIEDSFIKKYQLKMSLLDYSYELIGQTKEYRIVCNSEGRIFKKDL